MHSSKLHVNFMDRLKACGRQLQNFLPLGYEEFNAGDFTKQVASYLFKYLETYGYLRKYVHNLDFSSFYRFFIVSSWF